ncbi:universal stress protein PHOS34-like [Phragmites australis]|uniref:universal stress protein PHOS34-like n=1 Tax=Phragmites australis TaxID=29695 RepID=UPI002D779847|nr:universal stress protein PHOS34-like [Phragmites australis]
MEEGEAVAASGGAAGGEEAERTTTKAPAPALKVVAAVDASEESLHALSWALDNIVRCHPDAALVVVHAHPGVDHFVYPVAAYGIATAYVPASAVESMRKAQEEISRRIVARALDICKAKQVDATAAIVEGDAKEAICQAVERMQAGLLVLGSRGLGKIKRAFLGSVSDYLTHQACCPVLVVKPPKAHAK